MRLLFIPPGGFQGFAEQSIAVKALVSSGLKPARRKARTRKKPVRRKKTTTRRKRAAPVRRRRATVRKKPQRMVKGSAAAKRHMAKLRKMRKR